MNNDHSNEGENVDFFVQKLILRIKLNFAFLIYSSFFLLMRIIIGYRS